MEKKIFSIIWAQYSGRITCTMLAFFIGIVYLIAGFWKMLIFSSLVIAGYFIGQYIDRKESWKDTIDKVFLKRWVDKS